jgi:hypothetical protein
MAAFTPAPAEASCPPPRQKLKINFRSDPGKIFYKTMSEAEILRQVTGEKVTVPANRRTWHLDGVTVAAVPPSILLQVKPSGLQKAQRLCVYPSEVDVFFGFESLTVYIAADLPFGGCRYNVALEHENRHVSIWREEFNRFLPLIKARVNDEAHKLRPIETSINDKAAWGKHQTALWAKVNPLYLEFLSAAKMRNTKMDTPAAYARESSRCEGKK